MTVKLSISVSFLKIFILSIDLCLWGGGGDVFVYF